MPSKFPCFMTERMDLARVSLRRFTFSGKSVNYEGKDCPGREGCGHNAEVVIDPAVDYKPKDPNYNGERRIGDPNDPRWPTICDSCDYEFTPGDEFQHVQERLYKLPNGMLVVQADAPPGAMFYSQWHEDHWGYKGPDGRCLQVMLPPGGISCLWEIDGPANNGPGWTRTGEPPNVSAQPSIKTSQYHGFLTNGVLEACGDSPT